MSFLRNQELGGHCGRMATKSQDELVSSQFLKAIEPAALELSISAIANVDSDRTRLHLEWERRLERVKYECERAERQYRSVEPENRLVARTLESAWELALIEVQKNERGVSPIRTVTPTQLSQEEIEAIRDLSASIPKLWSSSATTYEDRKRIIRALIDKVIVIPSLENENVDVRIHWHGGFQSQHMIYKAVGSYRQLQDYDRLCERIRELHSKGWHHAAIADQLNNDGFVPPRRRGVFTYQNVGELIRRIGLQRELFQDILKANEWWIPDLANKLGVIQQRVSLLGKTGMGSLSKNSIEQTLDRLGRQRRTTKTKEALQNQRFLHGKKFPRTSDAKAKTKPMRLRQQISNRQRLRNPLLWNQDRGIVMTKPNV